MKLLTSPPREPVKKILASEYLVQLRVTSLIPVLPTRWTWVNYFLAVPLSSASGYIAKIMGSRFPRDGCTPVIHSRQHGASVKCSQPK